MLRLLWVSITITNLVSLGILLRENIVDRRQYIPKFLAFIRGILTENLSQLFVPHYPRPGTRAYVGFFISLALVVPLLMCKSHADTASNP